jgi:N-methylhydantoinase A
MAQTGTSRFRIGIDTGGTFTDIVAVDTGSGAMRVTKVASTPSNPAVGLVRGVTAILEKAGATAADVGSLSHGTTVATNARASAIFSRSRDSRCPRATAIPISG